MKHLRAIFSVSLILLLTASLLTGCAGKSTAEDSQPVDTCPFSELNWESTVEDMTAAEGSGYTTSDSIYEGTAYTYPKSYLDMDGSIKYMFDSNDKLMCIAWTCTADTAEDLISTYDQIHKQLVDVYGESGYNVENKTTAGDVWYPEGGDIILSSVNTDVQKALQYSYLNPEVSNTESEN